jgi:hypothetical protein
MGFQRQKRLFVIWEAREQFHEGVTLRCDLRGNWQCFEKSKGVPRKSDCLGNMTETTKHWLWPCLLPTHKTSVASLGHRERLEITLGEPDWVRT